MFRRRRSSDDADPDAMPEENEAEAATGSAAVADGSHGPWDSADAPDDGTARVDLGSLHVPVVDGMEVRVDMQDQHVVAATLVDGNSTMQVHAFAAPKSSGIWAEVREEIAASIREGGGSADEAAGELGPELRARVPAQPGGQFAAMQSLRFIGVDGPRWFLRGLLTGPAATDDVQAVRGVSRHRRRSRPGRHGTARDVAAQAAEGGRGAPAAGGSATRSRDPRTRTRDHRDEVTLSWAFATPSGR